MNPRAGASGASAEAGSAAYHPSWTVETQALVERAVAAHGGRARFQSVGSIRLGVASLTGALPWAKGVGRTFPVPTIIEIWPHQRTAIFHAYPDPDQRGRFVDGAVTLESTSDGAVLAHSPQHRDTFAGPKKLRRWRPLDALYFFGYALCHYHAVPFSLGAATLVRPVRQRGCDGVEVDFPTTLPTHSRRQRFFFGTTGAIVRHDYVADIVGPWARGCHLWLDYESCDGFLVARHRRVVVRTFGRPTPITVLEARLSSVAIVPA
jgi:hypothetical protein